MKLDITVRVSDINGLLQAFRVTDSYSGLNGFVRWPT